MFEIEVVIENEVSCIPCVTYLQESDGETGYDCERDGVTVEKLPIKPGFWRSSNKSLTIFQCNIDSACIGGDEIENSDSYCETGNIGPYCQVCGDGYRKSISEKCIKCGKNQAGLISVSIIVILLSVLLAIIVLLYLLL